MNSKLSSLSVYKHDSQYALTSYGTTIKYYEPLEGKVLGAIRNKLYAYGVNFF